jgi:hypothetical protein
MKKLYILVLSFIAGTTMAQTQMPEGGFNNWTPSTLNTYYEPTGGWWTTLNSLVSLGGPVTVSRSNDVHSGTFAAKLETKQWGTFLLPGLLVSGNFILTSPFIKQGKPFTDKPSKFKGWIKYTSVNSDSAAIVALLTKFNTGTGKQDTIARAVQIIKNDISVYTPFDINFDYSNTSISPDSIILVLTSSADGGNFHGQVGSTLFVDDISLEYATGLQESLMPEFSLSVFPSPAAKQLLLEFNTSQPEQLRCIIYSINGRFIQSFTPSGKNHQLDVSGWEQDCYLLQAWMGKSLVSSAKFVIVH